MLVQALSYNTQKLRVGLFYQGGIIVYVNNNTRQGLIGYNGAYGSNNLAWGPNGAYTNMNSETYGNGYTNTQNAYNTLSPASNTALYTVWNATFNGYSDWFLPSKDEAVYIYQSKQYFSFWDGGTIWTSTNYVGLPDNANWTQSFDGTQGINFRSETNNRRSIACRYITFT
jgi:hypothetical protein